MSTQDIPAEPAPSQRDSIPKELEDGQETSSPAAGLALAQGEASGSSKLALNVTEDGRKEESNKSAEEGKEIGEKDVNEDEEEREEGEAVESSAPPLPKEPTPPSGAPLPAEPVPAAADDGWECQWDPAHGAWYFHNRYTGTTQWDNPRQQDAHAAIAPGVAAAVTTANTHPPITERPAAGGYNPAIHGDYDPNAWYAQNYADEEGEAGNTAAAGAAGGTDPYTAIAHFNRFTGQFQTEDQGPTRHGDEAKSRRQMNAFFDVDAAANAHDGRSLKAERSNKRVSKSELKQFKEKRRAKKEEKRRAWLRD